MSKLLAVASIVAMLASPALAQPDQHHPDQAPTQGMTGPMSGQGMMMGQGMMGQGMMMSCPMMGMMGSGNPHTEGRIAFLKTELKITDPQEKAWASYADALRVIDKRRGSATGMMGPGMTGQGMMGPGMMQQGGTMAAPEMLEKRVQMAETHLKNLKDLQAATKKLYRELNDTQKKTADELLGMPCGMGGM